LTHITLLYGFGMNKTGLLTPVHYDMDASCLHVLSSVMFDEPLTISALRPINVITLKGTVENPLCSSTGQKLIAPVATPFNTSVTESSGRFIPQNTSICPIWPWRRWRVVMLCHAHDLCHLDMTVRYVICPGKPPQIFCAILTYLYSSTTWCWQNLLIYHVEHQSLIAKISWENSSIYHVDIPTLPYTYIVGWFFIYILSIR